MAQQDACTLLDDDHNETMRMFEQYKAAHDARQQQVIAAQLSQALIVHMQIEEEVFYPAFQRATDDDKLLEESVREHDEARELIRKIGNDRQNAKLMLELEDVMLDHINDEREKMFPEARATKGLDLFKLADELEARKSELMAGAA